MKWSTLRLGNVCNKIGSGATPRGGSEVYLDSGEVTLIRSQNVLNFGFSRDGLVFLDRKHADELENVTVQSGDVLLNITGDSVARCWQVPDDVLPARVNQHVAIIRPRPDTLDPRYLRYYLTNPAMQRHMLMLASAGATRNALTKGMIESFEIVAPGIDEQRTIARVLGALDDKIELNRRMNETLEAMARAIFKSWFVDFDPVRAKAAGRKPDGMDAETAALFPNAFEDSPLGKIPKGWEIATIDKATSLIIDYRGKTPKKLSGNWSLSGIPAISARNIKNGRFVEKQSLNFVDEHLYSTWMRDVLAIGDTLLTSEAPLGELLFLARESRYCLSQRVFALRSNREICLPAYLYLWLSSSYAQANLRARATGTTVVGIRQSELRKVEVLTPTLRIQQMANQVIQPCLEQIAANEAESETLSILRDTLLPKLLSGEVRVKDVEAVI